MACSWVIIIHHFPFKSHMAISDGEINVLVRKPEAEPDIQIYDNCPYL